MKSKLYFSFFCCCAFGVISKIPNPRSQKIYSVFLLKFYKFSSYILVFDPFCINFCIWHEVGIQFHYFVCGYPVDRALFVKQTISSLFEGILVENKLTICEVLFLDSKFYSTDVFVHLYPVLIFIYCNCYSLQYLLKLGRLNLAILFFLFKTVTAIRGFLEQGSAC